MYLGYNLFMVRYYKGVRVNSLGLPIFSDSKNKRIKKKDRNRDFYLHSFLSFSKKSSPKNLLVIYDIPESVKRERDWFRRHLIKFGFVMVQRSVWVGPSPLPEDFLSYVKEIGLKENFKTFKLEKSYK